MPSLRALGHAFRAWRRNKSWAKHEPETPYLADLLSGAISYDSARLGENGLPGMCLTSAS